MASKWAMEHTHSRDWKYLGQFIGFHMHCLKSSLKVCPQSQLRHPQAVHMFYGKQHLSGNETF